MFVKVLHFGMTKQLAKLVFILISYMNPAVVVLVLLVQSLTLFIFKT